MKTFAFSALTWVLKESIRLVPWRLRSRVKGWPIVGALQRGVLERVFSGREFIHIVDSGPGKGLVYPIQFPTDKGIWTGTYELLFCTAIAKAVVPSDICYDVGAWRGFVTGIMALAKAKKVYAFEPLSENAEQVRRVGQLNPQLSIEVIEAAVTDKDGTAEFLQLADTSMGKLGESTFQRSVSGKRKEVRAVSLDHLSEFGGVQLPNIIKIDVEGAEMLVLRGAARLLKQTQPRLFIEVHSGSLRRECTEFLQGLGYTSRVMELEQGTDIPEVCHIEAVPLA